MLLIDVNVGFGFLLFAFCASAAWRGSKDPKVVMDEPRQTASAKYSPTARSPETSEHKRTV